MGNDDLNGIILLSNKKGFYVVVEGYKRLIAIYKYFILEKKDINCLKSIEFIIGFTKDNWEFYLICGF